MWVIIIFRFTDSSLSFFKINLIIRMFAVNETLVVLVFVCAVSEVKDLFFVDYNSACNRSDPCSKWVHNPFKLLWARKVMNWQLWQRPLYQVCFRIQTSSRTNDLSSFLIATSSTLAPDPAVKWKQDTHSSSPFSSCNFRPGKRASMCLWEAQGGFQLVYGFLNLEAVLMAEELWGAAGLATEHKGIPRRALPKS